MKYELSDDDVKLLHDAKEHLRVHNRPAALDCIKALTDKIPAPKPVVKYRLRDDVTMQKNARGDLILSSRNGNQHFAIDLPYVEPLFEVVSKKIPGVFNVGDWVRDRNGDVCRVQRQSTDPRSIIVRWMGTDDDVMFKDLLVHCEAR